MEIHNPNCEVTLPLRTGDGPHVAFGAGGNCPCMSCGRRRTAYVRARRANGRAGENWTQIDWNKAEVYATPNPTGAKS